VQRLEVTANVKSPVLYKSEAHDTEIIFGDVCIEECIPLGAPSPAAASSRATIENSDIQNLDHETAADLKCMTQTAPRQGRSSV